MIKYLKWQHFVKTIMIRYDNSGISLAHSETAKYKCGAPPKFKQRLNIVIHGRKDPVMMHPTLAIHNAQHKSK